MAIKLTSPAFANGEPIPKQYTGEGPDLSPPLCWSDLPKGVKELALVCDEPDALTKEPWVHWLIYKIPATVGRLPEGIPRMARLADPPGVLQGKNSWVGPNSLGYRGPIPPLGVGPHHYHFKLYALKSQVVLEPNLDKKTLLNLIQDYVLDEGVLVGTYRR